jgi:hypothetical protein
MVYVLAALIGVAAALLLLPSEPPSEEQAQADVEAQRAEKAERALQRGVPGDGEEGTAEAQQARKKRERGVGGNPKARRIREALDTPQHALLARTSPVWVQIQKVLREEASGEWLPEVEALLQDLEEARRDMALEGAYLVGRQNSLLESLWNAELSDTLSEALKEPLAILSERIQAFEN